MVSATGSELTSQPLAPPEVTPEQRRNEYVAGGVAPWFGKGARSLPWAIDDVTGIYGIDLYERMRHDPQVEANLIVYWASIIEDGFTFHSAVSDRNDPEYDLANEIRDEAEAMYARLDTDNLLYDQLSAIWNGNSVAEVVYGPAAGITGKQRLNVTSIKVKPPWATAFVVDAYSNLVGLLALFPGQPAVIGGGVAVDLAATPNRLPREKFCILSFRPRYNDPRGTSILRAVFEPWNDKRQTADDYRKYLSQFAGPSLVGETAPGAELVQLLDANGNTMLGADGQPVLITAQQAMFDQLKAFRNGSIVVVPNGATVKPMLPQGNGQPFLRNAARNDQQITKGILTQNLTTEEGEHQARAAAQVHQDVQDTLIRQGKRFVQRAHRSDVLEQWTVLNWGERARHLTPLPLLGAVEQHDMAQMMTGVANLQKAGYFYSQSQLQETDRMLGLPERDLSAPSDLVSVLPAAGTVDVGLAA